MGHRADLLELLEYINPAGLEYQEWLNVGMALNHEGYSAEDWDTWSRRDPGRYHPGECARKWNGFHGSSSPVTGGTIVQMARENGWTPIEYGGEMDWDSPISAAGSSSIGPAEKWGPAEQLIKYLETLFKPEEFVSCATGSWKQADEKGTRWLPKKSSCGRTAGQLIEKLKKYGDDIGAVVGDYLPEAGAWIRFNPLGEGGCADKDVTDYRYALVESDKIPINEQLALIKKLNLPVACMVHSGGKSIHAIVRVGASSLEEYQGRVRHLYKTCTENGFKVDTQNKNPSRLSRMPGVMRSGKEQRLIAVNTGAKNWDEWVSWMENEYDGLPEPECLSDSWDHMPPLAPCLIEGVLRMGHKMLIAGPSKAGKSYLQIELCIAIAEGRKWLGWSCAQGRVLYVNLELDSASCLHRFRDVYQALHWDTENLSNIDIWNLRGKSVPMDKLAPKLIRRAAKKNYTAVVIDPIYKIITGDENSADQMARFCNQFDLVCTELGCAVIYCHHHSKGAQGGKKSMDRASGSGVFARDPDALLDLIELEPTDDLIKQEINKALCRGCLEWIRIHSPSLEDGLSEGDMYNPRIMADYCENKLPRAEFEALGQHLECIEEKVKKKTAWRIEGTLREFPRFSPVNTWFDYPIHVMDDVGVLGDIQPENEKPPWQRKKKSPEDTWKEKEDLLRSGFGLCDTEGTGRIKLSELCDAMGGKAANTVKSYVKRLSKEFKIENGMVIKL